MGVIAAEAVGKEGLRIAELEPASMEKLNAILPSRWSHGNPVDTAGIFNRPADHAATVLSCLGILMEDDNIDCVISLASPVVNLSGSGDNYNADQIKSIQNGNRENLKVLGEYIRKNKKPLIINERATGQSADDETNTTSLYLKEGIPVYHNAHRAARVVRYLVWYQHFLDYAQAQTL